MKFSSQLFVAVAILVCHAASGSAQARFGGGAPSQGTAVARPAPPGGAQTQPPPSPPRATAPAQAAAPAPPAQAPAAAPPTAVARTGGVRVVPPTTGTAVPRTAPRLIGPEPVPNTGAPAIVVPRVDPPFVTARPGDNPVYAPDYRSTYSSIYAAGGTYRSSYPSRYPYYTFRPHVRVGFGLWVGYPVHYPYVVRPYVYPYYAPTYPIGTVAYPYPAAVYQAPRAIPVPSETPGGLSFDITPSDAQISVDGQYYGTVGQFTSTQPPLWLTPGVHQVEVRAPGYQTVVFDVEIVSGQVIPYQGSLRRF